MYGTCGRIDNKADFDLLTFDLYQALQERRNENDIEAFLKMVGSFQRYIHIKTPALHFDFETCSAQFIQRSISLLENLFVAVSFDIVMSHHK